MSSNDVTSLGLFYSNYKDAVKEGDGQRVKLCWKYPLPIFKASDKRNYSGEVLQMLYSCNYTLSPRQTQQLLYSQFINTHGLPSSLTKNRQVRVLSFLVISTGRSIVSTLYNGQ